MAEFTEDQIQEMLWTLRNEYVGPDATRELAILELEDWKRKGCTLEHIGECHGCSATENGNECPLCGWQKRHPEYMNDELAHRIEVLEAGGEEAYKAKLKAKEEAKKQKEAHEQALADAKKKIDAAVIKIRNETGDDKAWWKELDDAVEAYVQLRMKKV